MLKCSKCGTIDQLKFSEYRKKRYKGKKDTVLNWCKDCLKQIDIERRDKNKLNKNLNNIVTCPKCGKSGDYSSGLFMKSRYLFAKEKCVCKTCRRADPKYRVRKNQAKRIRESIRNYLKFKKKHEHTMKLIGCNIQELVEYLEKQFKLGMTWDNYGTYWHIDHIRPIASFNLENPEELNQCFYYTNLQPLTAQENLEKGDKIL